MNDELLKVRIVKRLQAPATPKTDIYIIGMWVERIRTSKNEIEIKPNQKAIEIE